MCATIILVTHKGFGDYLETVQAGRAMELKTERGRDHKPLSLTVLSVLPTKTGLTHPQNSGRGGRSTSELQAGSTV